MFNLFNLLYRITYPINYFLDFCRRFIPGGKRIGEISLAAKVALTLWIALMIAVALAIFLVWYNTNTYSWATDNIWRLVLVGVLTLLFPFVVYWMVRFISTERVKLMPDIDAPWEAGVKKLKELGIDAERTPLVLILGSDSGEGCQSLHRNSYFKMEVAGEPQGESHFLHWFAGRNGIFLHPKDVSRTSVQVRHLRKRVKGGSPSIALGEAVTIGGNDSIDSASFFDETIDTTSDFAGQLASETSFGRGTLTGDDIPSGTQKPVDSASAATSSGTGLETVNEFQLAERLRYLSRLIKKLRRDEVPIDGVVVFIPFPIILERGSQIANAVHDDLRQLRDNLGSNFPVTIMVSEMQNVEGFVTLAHQLGERANMARFGLGFEIENLPSQEDMQALGRGACEAFQQHVFNALAKQSLDNTTNSRRLFGLLKKVSLDMRDKLSSFLQKIVLPPEGVEPRDYVALTGCYFAATGEPSQSEWAFVNGIVEKSLTNCENTHWTLESKGRERVYKGMAGLFSLMALVCGLATVAVYYFYFTRSSQ